MASGRSIRVIATLAAALAGALLLAGCEEQNDKLSHYRAFAPLSPESLELMRAKDTDKNAPMLIRAYKKEAELEIWKQKKDGKYVFFKSYPMCRWSGQLGPKKTEGDRQVPEGFYSITPGQMNPNSHYYLSFNVGYPNAYDRANGRQGGNIMVHGICSSAGCFSMTDKQIEEIYAVARESFAGGQRAVQMQSYPFRMTAENMAKLRLDANMPFWREIKKGSDYFEVTKLETPVGVCNKHYVFGATPKSGRFDALSSCPPLVEDAEIKTAVDNKAAVDDRDIAELVGKGVKPVRIVYADGGQNDHFKTAKIDEVSRPDALAAGATEIALDDGVKVKPVVVQVASSKAAAKAVAQRTVTPPATPAAETKVASADTSVVPAAFEAAPIAYAKDIRAEASGLFKKVLSFGSAEAPEAAPAVQMQPPASAATAEPVADKDAKKGARRLVSKAKPATTLPIKAEQLSSRSPNEVTGASTLPATMVASSTIDH